MRLRNALIWLAAFAAAAAAQPARALFVNGNFESGSFAGWTQTHFLNHGLTCPPTGPCDRFDGSSIVRDAGGFAQSTIVGPAAAETLTDPILDPADSLRLPKFGRYAARVNGPLLDPDGFPDYKSSSLLQTATVAAADVDPLDNLVHVRFAFAPVLENPPHDPQLRPYFYLALKNVTQGNKLLYERFVFANGPGVPWKPSLKPGSDVLYTDWQVVDLAPGAAAIAVGDQISLEVVAADCGASGHFGYVYVDGFGSQLPGLSVEKSGPPTVEQGANLTYTLVYKNLGASPVGGVVVTETLPPQTTFVAVSDPRCAPAAGAVTCNFGTLAPGTAGTFQITVAVAANATGTIVNGDYSIQGRGVGATFGPPVSTVVEPVVCARISGENVLCATDGSGTFTYTFSVKNLTAKTIHHLFLMPPAGVTVNPDYFDLSVQPTPPVPYPRPIPPGASSGPLTVTIKNAAPGTSVTLGLTFLDANLDQCCQTAQVVPLPKCDCAQLLQPSAACKSLLPGNGFDLSFVVQSLTPGAETEILLAPLTPTNVTIQKDQFNVSLPGFGAKTPPLSIHVGGPGALFDPVCFLIGLHDQGCAHCCSVETCVSPTFCPLLPYDPIGNAQIFSAAGQVVTLFDESGASGVAVSLDGATKLTTAWYPLDAAGPLADGARLTLAADGRVAGGGDRLLGSLSVTAGDGRQQVAADWSDLGAATQRVEVFSHGAAVAAATGPAGPAATLAGWPTGGGAFRSADGAPGFFFDRPDTMWQIAGGPAVLGDEIRVTAEGAPGVDALTRFSLLAAGIPAVVLSDESVESPAAGTDLDLPLSTGYDQAAGATLPAGAADDDWQLSTAGGPPSAARLVIGPPPAWPRPLPGSAWISADPAGGRSLPGVRELQLESCFCIGPLATDVALDLELFADDGATVLLNGTAIGGPAGSGFRSRAPLAIHRTGTPGDGLFQSGSNCLTVELHDTGGVATGLDLAGKVHAARGTCF